jgi:hypothetical protein
MSANEMQQKDAAGERFAFVLGEGDGGQRLDRYLAERPELDRKSVV